ncbi:hypothetical protein [Actinokineospora bangkokensis]|uniref:hypothetical protein n=1 Tax=Actinokineospora bangkokensis TaxID=1193682 RepID=UPI0011776059|nr:hypothetical protein [Actinokineospora bangkokensis]
MAAITMVPGLTHIGGKPGSRFPNKRNDLDSVIREGFLEALDVADARARKTYGQLHWAAFRHGHKACKSERRRAIVRSELADVADLSSAGGHNYAGIAARTRQPIPGNKTTQRQRKAPDSSS